MKKLSENLRQNKIKVTPQRLAVLSVVREARTHASVEQVFQRVRESIPGVSLSTVYSVLEYLRDKGLIREIKIDSDRALYEARSDGHHHFLCERCHKIYDIDIPLCATLRKREVEGHSIDAFQGYFYGRCKACR
ncbi:MAG: Fur family transcriptional regulator [Candidatus Omnitrophota bacterium]